MGTTKYSSSGESGTNLVIGLEVDFTTTGNVTLSGLAVQANGDWPSQLTPGKRILNKDQTSPSENGVWIAASGSWTRATDFNSTTNILQYSYFLVTSGSLDLAGTGWMLATAPPYVVGTTPLVFTGFTQSSTSTAALSWTPPAANADGMWMTYNGLYVNIAGNTQRINSADAQYQAHTTAVTVANTATATTFLPGTVPLSIAEQTTNNVVNITLDGSVMFANLANTLTISVKLGSTVVAQVAILGSTVAGAIINTSYHYYANIRFSAQTINGSAATVVAFGKLSIVTVSGATDYDISGTATANTRVPNALDVTATWSAAASNNSITSNIMQVQHINSVQ